MIQIDFSSEAIDALYEERRHHPQPHIRQKLDALYLKSQGLAHQDICRIVRITKATLVSYLKAYQEGGIAQLTEDRFHRPQSELDQHRPLLEDYFCQHPPVSIAEAQSKIEALTGLHRSPTQIRQFLQRIGMKCRKVGSVPAKAIDEEKVHEQETFKEEKLEPRLHEAQQGERDVFF
jgi:transposase